MKLASLKLILAVVLVSSVIGSHAFAQSALRADEKIKNPQSYRLGDSEDLQGDQIVVDGVKVCNEIGDNKIQNVQKKDSESIRLIKHSDYI